MLTFVMFMFRGHRCATCYDARSRIRQSDIGPRLGGEAHLFWAPRERERAGGKLEKRALKESVYCGAKYTRSQQRRQEWSLARQSIVVQFRRGGDRLWDHIDRPCSATGGREGGNNEAIAKVSSR